MHEEHRKYAEPRVFWINCKYSLVKINDYRNVQSDKAERARTTILFCKKIVKIILNGTVIFFFLSVI